MNGKAVRHRDAELRGGGGKQGPLDVPVAVEKGMDRAEPGEQMGEMKELNIPAGAACFFPVTLYRRKQLRGPLGYKVGSKKSEGFCGLRTHGAWIGRCSSGVPGVPR